MKTGKETRPAGGIHRQQLFYWMGRSFDERNKGRTVLSNELITELIRQLRGSFEKGLWVKAPRYPEEIACGGMTLSLKLPIACFTEWSLGESLPHTKEYGRIGFGFPKRWIIDHGGQSVTYFQHNQKGSFLRCAFHLLSQLGDESLGGVWTAKAGVTGLSELIYLLHFAKMIRLKKAKPPSKLTAPPPFVRMPGKRIRTQAATDAQSYKRRFGHPLEFVEEREWRIVYNPSNKGFVKGPGLPDYYLPYIPGDELFTLVLPDNKVISRVLQTDWFTERLFAPWKHYPELNGRRVPPVILLSHSDIGTY
jgi:hypothetical protein